MGWKGTLRTINASIKQAERDAKRRQRELEIKQKQYEKMQELEQAAYEVERFNNYIEVLQSIHKECSNKIDWFEILQSSTPDKPVYSGKFEQKAILAKEAYKPNFLDRLFKRVEKKLDHLELLVKNAKAQDLKDYEESVNTWEEEKILWKKRVQQAEQLIAGDPQTKLDTLKEFEPFSELGSIGSSLLFRIHDNALFEAVINIHGEDIVPKEQKTLLKSGKLSIKKMAVGRFNEIYQDYVCSSVLRVANEIFALLPEQYILINAKDKLINKSTGNLEEQIILSVFISRETLYSMNMDRIDPSDAMKNFLHQMSFKKNSGFEPVEQVSIPVM